MPLVPAICPQCGATLTVDSAKEAAICESCGTPFVVEKAINNYTSQVTNNLNIANANVTVTGNNVEELVEKAEVYMTKLKDYSKAFETYRKISEDFPADYRGWWGLVRAKSQNFSLIDTVSVSNKEWLVLMYNKACLVATEEQSVSIEKKWHEYKARLDKFHFDVQERYDAKTLEFNNKNNEYNVNLERVKAEIDILDKKIEIATYKSKKAEYAVASPFFIVGIFLSIVGTVLLVGGLLSLFFKYSEMCVSGGILIIIVSMVVLSGGVLIEILRGTRKNSLEKLLAQRKQILQEKASITHSISNLILSYKKDIETEKSILFKK